MCSCPHRESRGQSNVNFFGSVRQKRYIYYRSTIIFAIDHRMWKTGLPVRSAVLKPHTDQLVLRWVTTWES